MYVPSLIPDGFERDNIFVPSDEGGLSNGSVMQVWSNPKENSYFIVDQRPGLKGLVETGRPITIRGMPGELVVYPSHYPDRPADAAYYWSVEGIGIVVIGSVSGSLTESTLKEIAESMKR